MPDTPDGAPAPTAARTLPETRDVLAVISTLLFAASYIAPWIWGIPKGAETYIGQAQGAIITQWALIMGWYFGSSKAATAVRDQLGKALNKLPDAGS